LSQGPIRRVRLTGTLPRAGSSWPLHSDLVRPCHFCAPTFATGLEARIKATRGAASRTATLEWGRGQRVKGSKGPRCHRGSTGTAPRRRRVHVEMHRDAVLSRRKLFDGNLWKRCSQSQETATGSTLCPVDGPETDGPGDGRTNPKNRVPKRPEINVRKWTLSRPPTLDGPREHDNGDRRHEEE